ncbi:MAG: superinfection immunity protein [Chloroflexi bacterium]|nr:MAG: superinfection immunity protein [Chloroflexota bacterium]
MRTPVVSVWNLALIVPALAVALVFLAGDDSTGAAAGASFGVVILFVILGALYFLPTIIAALRHHHNTAMIAILNFFLGWTFIGWVIFLAMSFGNPSPQQTIIHNVYGGPVAPPAPTAATPSRTTPIA